MEISSQGFLTNLIHGGNWVFDDFLGEIPNGQQMETCLPCWSKVAATFAIASSLLSGLY